MKTEQDWQKLCELIARESDPERVSELVDQLITSLDAHREALRQDTEEQRSRTTETRVIKN